MGIVERLERINGLVRDLALLQPMKEIDETRLWKKFRLEWDYNSNHLEGNTLTYDHVELLVYRQQIGGNYSTREVDEMRAHDLAIAMVRGLVENQERDLTESFIRDLNKIILVEPYKKKAINNIGQEVEKLIIPGEYKKTPNYVILPNGEEHYYSSPDVTPAEMKDLIDLYKTHSVSTDTHPAWLAAVVHYQLTKIHPFDDGNGRVARLIMNYILMRNQLPPVIVKSSDKKGYLMALNQADTGDLETFVTYILDQLLWSLEISCSAARGESIEEPNDLEKQIDVLKKKLKVKDDLYSRIKDDQSVDFTLGHSVIPLLGKLESVLEQFSELFNLPIERFSQMQVQTGHVGLGERTLNLNGLATNIKNHLGSVGFNSLIHLDFNYSLRGFKKSATYQSMSLGISFTFNEFNFIVKINGDNQSLRYYTYDTGVTPENIQKTISKLVEKLIEQISLASNLD